MSATLDWRELAPAQDTHYCDCDYCDQDGELEPIKWPTLVPVTVGGVDYVTDRIIMVRASLAPIPEGYEGAVLKGAKAPSSAFLSAPVADESAAGKRFRWHVIKAVQACDWRLRLLVGSDACAVITTDGEHIGWAMPAKTANDDMWNNDFTREYEEPDQ